MQTLNIKTPSDLDSRPDQAQIPIVYLLYIEKTKYWVAVHDI